MVSGMPHGSLGKNLACPNFLYQTKFDSYNVLLDIPSVATIDSIEVPFEIHKLKLH